MKLMLLVLTCIAVALVASACTETATPTNTTSPSTATSSATPTPSATVDELAATRANYVKNCEPCHGPGGEGGTVTVNDKQIKVASLKSNHAVKHTDEELINIVTNGEEEMPAFKDKLSEEEIRQLVRYVRTTYQGK